MTQMGYFAAGYAKQADLALHPPAEINIVGFPATTEEMRWAALSIDVPFRIVQVLDPERDAARLAGFSFPSEPSPAAYVCVGTACSAPVTDPDSLIETVRRMSSAGAPFDG
jgi:uncharacterized protein YyaL (SSP411 family)